MSVRRKNIEDQAFRLRAYVSEAVSAAGCGPLPMTQTLDQMVRSAAKAGVTLHIATEDQICAVEALSNQVRLLEIRYAAEVGALRKVSADAHEFIMHDARTRHMCDETGQVSPLFPKRLGILAAIDAAMDQGEQP